MPNSSPSDTLLTTHDNLSHLSCSPGRKQFQNRQGGQEQDTFLWQRQSSPGHCLSYTHTDHIVCDAGSHTTGEFTAFPYTRTSGCMFGWKDLSLPAGLRRQLFPSSSMGKQPNSYKSVPLRLWSYCGITWGRQKFGSVAAENNKRGHINFDTCALLGEGQNNKQTRMKQKIHGGTPSLEGGHHEEQSHLVPPVLPKQSLSPPPVTGSTPCIHKNLCKLPIRKMSTTKKLI